MLHCGNTLQLSHNPNVVSPDSVISDPNNVLFSPPVSVLMSQLARPQDGIIITVVSNNNKPSTVL